MFEEAVAKDKSPYKLQEEAVRLFVSLRLSVSLSTCLTIAIILACIESEHEYHQQLLDCSQIYRTFNALEYKKVINLKIY